MTDSAEGGEVVAENLHAVQAIYFAFVLEELRLFQVIERLAQLFSHGLLPITAPGTRDVLLAIAFGNGRLTAQDRRTLYARALGAPGGETGHAPPNRDFLALWLRFLSAVAAYAARNPAAGVLAPPAASNAGVRRAARALAANASSHGDGMTRKMAETLLAEVHGALDLLGSADVLAAFGARDGWQVIDLVNRGELGGARDVARYRAQAIAGSQVLRWLAEHRALLDDEAAAAAPSTPDGQTLVEAAEQALLAGSAHAPPGSDPAARDTAAVRPRRPVETVLRPLLDAVGRGEAQPSEATRAAPGPVVVFQGDRYTGKTTAAYLLAQSLGMDVNRIDLAETISKYIGETEKNLDAVFARAGEAGALLLVEEAGALFGRRTGVSDAHDRYANVDVGRLLQRIEAHRGVVVLTTNRKDAIDAGFVRRLRWVEFPN